MKQIFKRTSSVVLAVFALFILLANANAAHNWTETDCCLQTDGGEYRNLLGGRL